MMKVRITAVDGYTAEVPRDEPRFTWLPPTERDLANNADTAWVEKCLARVYMDVGSLDDVKWLTEKYGTVEIRKRNWEHQVDDDPDLLEFCILHDCYSA